MSQHIPPPPTAEERDTYLMAMSHVGRLPRGQQGRILDRDVLNHTGIVVQPPGPSPAFNRIIRYKFQPPYTLGYTAGDRQVRVQHFPISQHAITDPTDFSFDHPYSEFVSLSNLPAILFLLERPSVDPHAHIRVPVLCDQTGRPYTSSSNPQKPLRYFSFLPFRIPHKINGMLLEFWHRLDCRLEPSDIIDRMIPGPDPAGSKTIKQRLPHNNSISMRRQRFRELIHARASQPGRIDPCRNEIEELNHLNPTQIVLNTSMVVHDGRLWLPRLSSATVGATVIDYIDSGLPLDHFVHLGPPEIPSRRMLMTIALRQRLQNLAMRRGLGNDEDNWRKLEPEDRPSSWTDRGERGARERLNITDRENNKRKLDAKALKPPRRKAIEIDGLTTDEWLERYRLDHGITGKGGITAAILPAKNQSSNKIPPAPSRAGRHEQVENDRTPILVDSSSSLSSSSTPIPPTDSDGDTIILDADPPSTVPPHLAQRRYDTLPPPLPRRSEQSLIPRTPHGPRPETPAPDVLAVVTLASRFESGSQSTLGSWAGMLRQVETQSPDTPLVGEVGVNPPAPPEDSGHHPGWRALAQAERDRRGGIFADIAERRGGHRGRPTGMAEQVRTGSALWFHQPTLYPEWIRVPSFWWVYPLPNGSRDSLAGPAFIPLSHIEWRAEVVVPGRATRTRSCAF